MLQAIRHDHTGDVLFEAEIGADADVPEGVRLGLAAMAAIESGADLRGADLRGAAWGDGAMWAEGVMVTREPVFVAGLRYPAWILDRHAQIGCRVRTLDGWAAMSEAEVEELDGRPGAEFWRIWRDALLAVAKAAGRPLPLSDERAETP